MEIRYKPKADLVYIRLGERKQGGINRRSTEDVVLDIGADNRIIGIEILDASKHLNLCRPLAGQIRGVTVARGNCSTVRHRIDIPMSLFIQIRAIHTNVF